MWEAILGGIATVAGAYFGSAAAFRFNRLQSETDKKARQVEECNRTILLLSLQYSVLENYKRQRLDEFSESEGRHLLLRANSQFEVEHLRLNPAALAFLLTTDAREVPAEVSILNDRFITCIAVINARSRVHIEQYQPALEQAMVGKDATSLPGGEVETAIGIRLAQTLRSLTDDIYEHVAETMEDIANTSHSLHSRFVQVFPGQPVITFQTTIATDVPQAQG